MVGFNVLHGYLGTSVLTLLLMSCVAGLPPGAAGSDSGWCSLQASGGQNDDFRPLTSTLGGRVMGCRDKYVIS